MATATAAFQPQMEARYAGAARSNPGGGRRGSSVNDYVRWAHNDVPRPDHGSAGPAGPAAIMRFPVMQPAPTVQSEGDYYYHHRMPTSSKMTADNGVVEGEHNEEDVVATRPLTPTTSTNPSDKRTLVSRSLPQSPQHDSDRKVSDPSSSHAVRKQLDRQDGMTSQIDDTVADLISKLSTIVDSNRSALDQNIVPSSSAAISVEDEKYKKEHDKTRKDMISFMNSTESWFESSTMLKRLPRWKHRLVGNMRPLPSEVLGGIKLFRIIAWSIVVVAIRPKLAIRKRKLKFKDRNMTDLSRKLYYFADLACSWLGKFVNIPFISVENVWSLLN
jgi:hypothetical protein